MSGAPRVDLAALMALAQDGDQAAYARLLRAVQPMLRGYFGRRVADAAQAEDLAQDVLLKVHAYRATFDPSQKFETWMFAIASRTLIDHFRARGVRSAVTSYDATIEELASEAPVAETHVALRDAVARMSESERATFAKAKIDGEDADVLAKELGTTVGAANVRVHRAANSFLANLREGEDGAAPAKVRRGGKS